MGEHVIRLPDVGEGVAGAELVEWQVKVGDLVLEDAILGAVMTDKATVEIPSPVPGEVLWLGAEIGETVAVGSPLIRLRADSEEAPRRAEPEAKPPPRERKHEVETRPPAAVAAPPAAPPPARALGAPRPGGEKPLAS